MDKRKKKTSYAQYAIYLKMLEEDDVFRTGIISKDGDFKSLSDKWAELAEKLNNCGGGPIMSSEEWKRRLNDWKNSTRSKFRKIAEKSASKQERVLTPLEQKALSLWGPTPTNRKLSTYGEDGSDQGGAIKIESVEIISKGNQDNGDYITKDEDEVDRPPTLEIEELVEANSPTPKRPRMDYSGEHDDTDLEKAIGTNNMQKLAVQLKRIANVKEEKLRFEIAKFKFRNPGFDFQLNIDPS